MIKFVAGFLCSLFFSEGLDKSIVELPVARKKRGCEFRVGPVNIPGSIFLCIGAILT